jgi:hypothetical protein
VLYPYFPTINVEKKPAFQSIIIAICLLYANRYQ